MLLVANGFIVTVSVIGASWVQRCEVWVGLLWTSSSQTLLDSGSKNDRKTECVYFVGEPMLKQPSPLSRRAGTARQAFNFLFG